MPQPKCEGFELLTTKRIVDGPHYEYRLADRDVGEAVIQYVEFPDGVEKVLNEISVYGGAIRLLGMALLQKADELGVRETENTHA